MKARTLRARRRWAVALVALVAACAAPPREPTGPAADTQVTQLFGVARRAYDEGAFAQARSLYQRALARARAIDDAALAADAAYNLAVTEVALQNYELADALLQQAGFDAARAATDRTEPLLLRAKVAYLRGRLPQAIALASAVIESSAAPLLRRQAVLLRGQIRAEQGDLAAARADLRDGDGAAGEGPSAAALGIAADENKLAGTIAQREGDHARAAQLFGAEADRLRAALRHRDLGRALARAAQAHLAAGDPSQAARQYFLAARTLYSQGDAAEAKQHVESSIAAAAQAGDDAAQALARALRDEISRRDGP